MASQPARAFWGLTLTVTLAGCSGAPPAADVEPSTTAAAASSAPASTSAPHRVSSATIPDGDNLFRNDTTVYSHCSGEFSSDAEGHGEVFNTRTGMNESIGRPPVPDGEEFIHAACTVTAVDGENRAIFVVTSRTPSSGLTPESTHTRIMAVTPGSTEPVLTKDWPAEIAAPVSVTVNGASVSRIEPTAGGFVAVGGMYSDTIAGIFDARTLGLTAHLPVSVSHGSSESLYSNFDGVAAVYKNGGADRLDDTFDAHFLSAVDGAEIGFFPNVGEVVPLDHGFLLSHSSSDNEDGSRAPGGAFYFDMRTRELIGPIAPWLDDETFPETVTDVERNQWGDRVLLRGYGFVTDSSFLDVYDLAARKSLFHLDNTQMEDLDVGNTYLGADYLYMEKDPDNPVIDFATSETASDGWSLRPVATLPDGWVLIQPDSPEGDSGDGAPHLQRAGAGDYAGPWF